MRKMTAKLSHVLLCVPAFLFAGCAATERPSLEERTREFMRPYEELKAQKAALWRAGWEPRVFDFEDHGRVTVRRWELSGSPGDVYVDAKVTYENTTDTPRSSAFVYLDVLDAEGHVMGSTAVRMVSPAGYPFWPGHTYSTEIRARTNGIHLAEAGWSWAIACDSQVETDPGPKPVIIDQELEFRRNQFQYSSLWRQSPTYTPAPVFSGRYSGPHVPGVTRW